MDTLMFLMMDCLGAYFREVQWDILMLKRLDLMRASNFYKLMLKLLALYLEIYMESKLGLMLEQIWSL